MSSAPPRRPGGARQMGPRPAQLAIPPDNVPGGQVDQAGDVGWVDARGIPLVRTDGSQSSATRASAPSPPHSLSPAPTRPSRPVLASPTPSSSAVPGGSSTPTRPLGRPARPVLASSLPSSSTVPASTDSPGPSSTLSPPAPPQLPPLSLRPTRPVLASPMPSTGAVPSTSRPAASSRPSLALNVSSSAQGASPTPSLHSLRPSRPVLASPLPSTSSVPSSSRPNLGINISAPPTSNVDAQSSRSAPQAAALPARTSSARPSLSLQVTPSSSAIPSPSLAPYPAPPPTFSSHSSSNSILAYDQDAPDDVTVRPFVDTSDAGAYSAYGAPGGSTSWFNPQTPHDRTMLPLPGGGAGNYTIAASSGSSLVDDLRQAVERASLASVSAGTSATTTPAYRPTPGHSPVPPSVSSMSPPPRSTSLSYKSHQPPSSASSSTSSTISSTSTASSTFSPYQSASSDTPQVVQKLEPLAFDPSELVDLAYLGEGAGGAVTLVKSLKSGRVMAKKVITSSPSPEIHRQILRELSFLSTCHHPNIVEHYGSFLFDSDSSLALLMEYCEGRSLDAVVKQLRERPERGRSSELVLGKIAVGVLGGLNYLHERRIIHRDIKPSNILVTRDGQFKICDFGVSGELVGSLAGTFTGTSFYMAPERILGQEYSIKSDVWSLGLSLLEVAQNRFPFPPEGEPPIVGQFDLLNFIVNQEPPGLKDDEVVKWGEGVKEVVKLCLTRDANDRPYPRDLLNHPFIKKSAKRRTPIAKWVAHVWGWDQQGQTGLPQT